MHQAKQTKNSDKFSKQVFSIFAAYNLKRGKLLSLSKQNIFTQNTLGFQINNTDILGFCLDFWYQGGVKSTVSGVFEDLKFKISEGYKQN